MKDEHVLDELSAYLDGEAEDADAIAAHLQRCPQCAKRYRELHTISGCLKALPRPDASLPFVTRVTAEVREVQPRRARWFSWEAITIAAVLTVVVAGAALRIVLTAGPPPPAAPYAGTYQEQLAAIEAQVVAELERRAAQGQDVTLPLVLGETDYVSTDDLLATLAQESWFEDLATEVEQSSDVTDLIDSLSPAETQTLDSLLSSSLRKG